MEFHISKEIIDIMEVSIDKIIVADAFASGKTKK